MCQIGGKRCAQEPIARNLRQHYLRGLFSLKESLYEKRILVQTGTISASLILPKRTITRLFVFRQCLQYREK